MQEENLPLLANYSVLCATNGAKVTLGEFVSYSQPNVAGGLFVASK